MTFGKNKPSYILNQNEDDESIRYEKFSFGDHEKNKMLKIFKDKKNPTVSNPDKDHRLEFLLSNLRNS